MFYIYSSDGHSSSLADVRPATGMRSMTMKDMETTNRSRYHCKVTGCNKTFQRREHLARHAKTHSESRYVCQVCQKEFTRSDSLQRHLGLHGEEYKPSPSGRSKRACVTCHEGKIKCDGGQPCSRCCKKGIDCEYDHQDFNAGKAGSKSPSPVPIFGDRVSGGGNEDSPAFIADEDVTVASGDNTAEIQLFIRERLAATFSKNKGPIDWSTVRVEKDTPPHEPALSRAAPSTLATENWPSLPDSEVAKYMKIYFDHYHHRWPILFTPIFEPKTAPPSVLSSVLMIGAWIHGTSDSKELANSLHTRVIDHIFYRLGQLSSEDSIDHRTTRELCEASLLCIVFGFYCGKEKMLSKASIIRSMLVTVLREMGVFKREMPAPYEKAGYFRALRQLKEGQRQRLATSLFKIDSYFSILRGQPGILTPEELHFVLPCTFALWNSDGLNVWEVRQSIEPKSRSQTTIYRTISEPALETLTPTDGLMLIEDIQLGICAMHSKIWQLRERSRDGPDDELSNAMERDSLKRRLDSWKYWIDRNPIQQTDYVNFSQEQHLAMRYYYGTEDHSQPGWQLIVFDRPKNLIFDTLMLYNLLNMHMYADIRILTQMAKDRLPVDPDSVPGEECLKAREQRGESIRAWAESAAARRALCHATDVLVSYSGLSRLEDNQVDPIVYVALSVAALVVWMYCMNGGRGCPACASEGQLIFPLANAPFVELTRWSGPKTSQFFEKDREAWIETGGCRGALTGTVLCRCNTDLLVAKFRGCIRDGCDVANIIAPGIFKPWP